MTETDPDSLVVGQQTQLTGSYLLNWEVSRLVVRLPGRWRRRRISCQLLTGDGVSTTPLAYLGQPLPGNWRHHPGLRFNVTVDATPVAEGRFGHLGASHWQLRVDRWISVVPVNGWPHHYAGARRWPLRGHVAVIGSEAQDAVFLRTDLVSLLDAVSTEQLRPSGEQRWLQADDVRALRRELMALQDHGLSGEDRQTVIQAIELVDYETANRTGGRGSSSRGRAIGGALRA